MEILFRIWETYPIVVDMALYFLVFGAAARAALAKTFPGQGGKVLSVAVGLILAISLAMAQSRLGFSIQKLGPVAALLLCLVILAAVFGLLRRAGAPKLLVLLLLLLVGVALARVFMPELTQWLIGLGPLIFLLVLGVLVIGAWFGTERTVLRFNAYRPAAILERHRVVPEEARLRRATRYVKDGAKAITKKDRKAEKRTERDLRRAMDLSERGNPDVRTKAKAAELIDRAFASTEQIRLRCEKLMRFDEALRNQDWEWLRRAQVVHLGRLTPEQQKLVRDSYEVERKRLNAETVLEKLQADVEAHMRKVQQHLGMAKSNLGSGDLMGASGWIVEAIQEDKRAQQIEDLILIWEERLLDFVKRQEEELARSK